MTVLLTVTLRVELSTNMVYRGVYSLFAFQETRQLASGIARPGPTRACALPSTFQALPSATQQNSHDSTRN